MSNTLKNILNNNYLLNTMFILASTQVFSIIKIFSIGDFIKTGSFVEFLNIVGSILVGILAIVTCLVLAIKKEDSEKNKPMTKKGIIKHFIVCVLGSIIMLWILDSIINSNPLQTLDNITTNTSHITDIIFNKTLYMIDIVLIFTIYATRRLNKFSGLVLKVLVFKILFMLGIYIAFLSYINLNNSTIDRNQNALLPIAYTCNDTYVETTYVLFIKNVDCPYRKQDLSLIELAKAGSTGAYISTMSNTMDMRKKSEIVVFYYLTNSKFEEKTWIENTLPSLYQKSILKISKDFYFKNKAAEAMVAGLILAGQENEAFQKAKSIAAENNSRTENKAQYPFLYYLLKI